MKYTEDILLQSREAALMGLERFAEQLTKEDLMEFKCCRPNDSIKVSLYDADEMARKYPDRIRMRLLWSTHGSPLLVGGWDALTGVAWFLTTDQAKNHPRQVLKGILECRDEALKECPHLVNVMMKSNKHHVELLEHIGAEFAGPVEPIGGEPFQAFYIKRKG